MEKKLINTSKFISLVLRHKPGEIGLQLDANGWADVNELLDKTNANGIKIDLDILKQIVETNEKKRFSFNEDFSKIRANQGHSVEVGVELRKMEPPAVLYHGTAVKNEQEILKGGLHKMSRLHVHLSDNIETALMVGRRHGQPIVFVVDAGQMHADGMEFFISENKVWLTEHVPAKYLKIHST
jgi:putative RNA 2'-phosphotransferase